MGKLRGMSIVGGVGGAAPPTVISTTSKLAPIVTKARVSSTTAMEWGSAPTTRIRSGSWSPSRSAKLIG